MTIDLRKAPKEHLDSWAEVQAQWEKNAAADEPSRSAYRYDENEPRDYHGRWTTGGDGGDEENLGYIKIPVADLTAPTHGGKKGSAAAYLLPDGTFTPERQALHDQIVRDALAGVDPVAGQARFVMLGGGPASGKSVSLQAGLLGDIPTDDAVQVNADDIKLLLPDVAAMADAGDPDWASYGHEESSYLAKRITAAAIETNRNVVLDGTGDNSPASVIGKISAARAAGYEVDGIYVTCDTETAVERATARAEQTGRMVAPTIVRMTHAAVSQVYPQVASEFDRTVLMDTNGNKPTIIARGTRGNNLDVIDAAAFQRFLDKAG